ncbi:MAG: O-antigen ligase family protein [Synergistaceae bacterium]|nr:O-antigen ligase family protein [Synergistaceae bacterium]
MNSNKLVVKKKEKFELSKVKKIPDKYVKLPLVPAWLLVPLWLVSLALPNLVYSGVLFADTLHIIKWAVTGVPIAIAAFVAGLRILFYGKDKFDFKIDLFALIWLILLIYSGLQYFWVNVSSPTGFVLEFVCFAAIWAFYVITYSSFPDWGLKIALILGNLNAAINVLFAELQIHNMNNLNFLKGTSLERLSELRNIILPTPGNYIGNTAQQNMFGLWTAVAVLGAVYLFVYEVWKDYKDERGRKIFIPAISIALSVICLRFAYIKSDKLLYIIAGVLALEAFLAAFFLGNKKQNYYTVFIFFLAAVNFWGLLNSTSRSGLFALLGGIIVMFVIAAWKFDRNYVIRFCAVFIVMISVFYASTASPRAAGLVEKTTDIIRHAENIGNRRGIWATSYAMLKEHPLGVGTGQYKWHYLEAQREGFKEFKSDWYRWQYTHWAHNEFLQWFCEGGWAGGIILLLMYLAWFVPAVIGLFKKPEISINTVWALGLASLINFAAIFTRPFHRIENMVWITLAFALSNREFFTDFKYNFNFNAIPGKFFSKLVALASILASIAGCLYISSGIYGNYVLRQALSTRNAERQLAFLEEANKHPIVYEETQRNLGHHYLQVGEQQNNPELMSKGFNLLWGHFKREPHSEDISKIINTAQKFQLEPILREMVSYFKPGTYHLVRRRQQASNGQVINALVLVNGPGEDAK